MQTWDVLGIPVFNLSRFLWRVPPSTTCMGAVQRSMAASEFTLLVES